MTRLLITLLFAAICFAASDCAAQLVGRRVRRSAHASLYQPPHISQQYRTQLYQTPQHRTQPTRQLPNYRNPLVSRVLDGPTPLSPRNPAEVNSRYIGGFHYSHFDDVGIPSGDVGIRGNAYRWDTW